MEDGTNRLVTVHTCKGCERFEEHTLDVEISKEIIGLAPRRLLWKQPPGSQF